MFPIKVTTPFPVLGFSNIYDFIFIDMTDIYEKTTGKIRCQWFYGVVMSLLLAARMLHYRLPPPMPPPMPPPIPPWVLTEVLTEDRVISVALFPPDNVPFEVKPSELAPDTVPPV